MSPKQTALIQVAKLVTLSVAIGILVGTAFVYLTVAQIGIAFAVTIFACLVKMVYDLELSKAEHLDALNKMK